MAKVKQTKSKDEVVFTWPILLLLVGAVGLMAVNCFMQPALVEDATLPRVVSMTGLPTPGTTPQIAVAATGGGAATPVQIYVPYSGD